MSDRMVVMEALGRRMLVAFNKGDLVDARNIEAFLAALEGMTDGAYEAFASEDADSWVAI